MKWQLLIVVFVQGCVPMANSQVPGKLSMTVSAVSWNSDDASFFIDKKKNHLHILASTNDDRQISITMLNRIGTYPVGLSIPSGSQITYSDSVAFLGISGVVNLQFASDNAVIGTFQFRTSSGKIFQNGKFFIYTSELNGAIGVVNGRIQTSRTLPSILWPTNAAIRNPDGSIGIGAVYRDEFLLPASCTNRSNECQLLQRTDRGTIGLILPPLAAQPNQSLQTFGFANGQTPAFFFDNNEDSLQTLSGTYWVLAPEAANTIYLYIPSIAVTYDSVVYIIKHYFFRGSITKIATLLFPKNLSKDNLFTSIKINDVPIATNRLPGYFYNQEGIGARTIITSVIIPPNYSLARKGFVIGWMKVAGTFPSKFGLIEYNKVYPVLPSTAMFTTSDGITTGVRMTYLPNPTNCYATSYTFSNSNEPSSCSVQGAYGHDTCGSLVSAEISVGKYSILPPAESSSSPLTKKLQMIFTDPCGGGNLKFELEVSLN